MNSDIHSKRPTSKKKRISWLKGKTYEQVFGKEKARLLKKNLSKSKLKLYRDITKHPRYKGLEKRERFLELIKKRDEYCCQLCGKLQTKKCPTCGGRYSNLDIHHIDGNRKNEEELNLILLCHSCHSGLQRIGKIKAQMFFEILQEIRFFRR